MPNVAPAATTSTTTPAKLDPVAAASLARLQATLVKAQAIYAAGSTYAKAKASTAQGLLTPQALTAASAQNAALGARFQAASAAAAATLAGADAKLATINATMASFTTTLAGLGRPPNA